MSQSKKRGSKRGSSAPGKVAQRRAASASKSSRPVVVKPLIVKDVVVAPPQSLRARIDKALPPFTVKRYVAIWLLGMVPLLILMVVLARGAGFQGNAPVPTRTPSIVAATRGITQTATGVQATSVKGTSGSSTRGSTNVSPGATASATPTAGKYMVVETTKGRIVARLYVEASANVGKTIANFEQKANSGAFNGRIFHRVEDWMVQGGDPTGTGQGGNGMPSEYNQLPFKVGALGVAHRAEPTINNDSQFFIVKSAAQYLNGQYTNWGEVVEGMDVVSKIVVGDKMTKVTVETRQ